MAVTKTGKQRQKDIGEAHVQVLRVALACQDGGPLGINGEGGSNLLLQHVLLRLFLFVQNHLLKTLGQLIGNDLKLVPSE